MRGEDGAGVREQARHGRSPDGWVHGGEREEPERTGEARNGWRFMNELPPPPWQENEVAFKADMQMANIAQSFKQT
eukprot:140589-Pyramimonas_sp.AAC.1